MRYTLAGGYQSNAENGISKDYCIQDSDRIVKLGSMRDEVRKAVEVWMASPGHRANLLDKWHRKVNVGIAWDTYSVWAFQHFEGDYIRYNQLPILEDGILSMAGKFINGGGPSSPTDLLVSLDYDPPPRSLTRGQLARSTCYDNGLLIAYLRPALVGGASWSEDFHETEHQPDCVDPYAIPVDAPPVDSFRDRHNVIRETEARLSAGPEQTDYSTVDHRKRVDDRLN